MKKKILLIDTDTTYIFILKQLLKKYTIVGEIVSAETGSEALDILKTDHKLGKMPHIIISAGKMLVEGGNLFITELENLNLINSALTKIVINNSNSPNDTPDCTIDSFTVAYYQKPLLNKQLLAILEG